MVISWLLMVPWSQKPLVYINVVVCNPKNWIVLKDVFFPFFKYLVSIPLLILFHPFYATHPLLYTLLLQALGKGEFRVRSLLLTVFLMRCDHNWHTIETCRFWDENNYEYEIFSIVSSACVCTRIIIGGKMR